MSAVFAFGWYFLLGPAIFQSHVASAVRLAIGAYAIVDLVFLGCLLLLFIHVGELNQPWTVGVLAMAMITFVAVDSIHGYQALHHHEAWNATWVLVRSLGAIFLGLDCLLLRLEKRVVATPEGVLAWQRRGATQLWRYLMPYLLVPAVVALVVYVARSRGNESIETGVYVSASILLELVFIHQFLAFRELRSYAHRSVRLESLASADPTTGLPNRRALVALLDKELERSERFGRPCTLLFIDLDHFKLLNDSFGHPAGDAALREFNSVVRTRLRGIDTLGRWGGEEFVAVLPETDTEAATMVAERIRAGIALHPFRTIGGARITCSVGVATFPGDGRTRDEVIELADRAMYTAKRLGRNQVRAASEPTVRTSDADRRSVQPHDDATLDNVVHTLAALAREHRREAGRREEDVAQLATRLASALGLDVTQRGLLERASRLRDVGLIHVPQHVLSKKVPLSPAEWDAIVAHPAHGVAIVQAIPALHPLVPIIRAHHERWDGSGYPEGLAGEGIPLEARILAVADAYWAMLTHRRHQPACTPAAAGAEVRRCSGTQFDPQVVAALEGMLESDPGLMQPA
jgi:diguanylate cyclase (GGDEF)-like protein